MSGRTVDVGADVMFNCLFSSVVSNACCLGVISRQWWYVWNYNNNCVSIWCILYLSGLWQVQFARDISHHHRYNYIKSYTNVYFYIFHLTNYKKSTISICLPGEKCVIDIVWGNVDWYIHLQSVFNNQFTLLRNCFFPVVEWLPWR